MKVYKVYVPWSKTTPELAEATVRHWGSRLKITAGSGSAWRFRTIINVKDIHYTPLAAWQDYYIGAADRLEAAQVQFEIAAKMVRELKSTQEG